jgi:hypothetical protein
MKLKAVKAFTYSTRRLLPGEVFEASSRDARLLLATRKVEAMRDPVELAPPPPALAKKIEAAVAPTPAVTVQPPIASPPAEDITALRAEYEAALGKKPFNGWDAATLREKIAAGAAQS